MSTCKTRDRCYKQSQIIWPWNTLGLYLLRPISVPSRLVYSLFLNNVYLINNYWISVYKTCCGLLFYFFQISKFHWNPTFSMNPLEHRVTSLSLRRWISNFVHVLYGYICEESSNILPLSVPHNALYSWNGDAKAM